MAKRFFISAFIVLCLLAAGASAQQKTGTLKGKIEDSKGKPIAGAEVRVMRHRDRSVKEATTDDSGRYSFELEPDDYTVSFDAEGFQGGTMVQMQQVIMILSLMPMETYTRSSVLAAIQPIDMNCYKFLILAT